MGLKTYFDEYKKLKEKYKIIMVLLIMIKKLEQLKI